MNKVFRNVALIVFVAVIAFSMVSCEDGDGSSDAAKVTFTIINASNSAITHIKISSNNPVSGCDKDVSIAAGTTFTVGTLEFWQAGDIIIAYVYVMLAEAPFAEYGTLINTTNGSSITIKVSGPSGGDYTVEEVR